MNNIILSHCKKLVSPVFKNRVLLEQTGVFRSVCSLTKDRCHSPCLSRCFTANVSSCQHLLHVNTSQLDLKRCYSEVFSKSSNSKSSTGVFQGESHEMDRDSSQSKLESIKKRIHNRSIVRLLGSLPCTSVKALLMLKESPETFSLDVLVSLLRQENAVDICVIKVPEEIKYAEYFIVVSGVSVRHLRAMALYSIKVYKFLKKAGEPNVKIEGKDSEDWMCIDFGNMVVHFMLPETRETYELEKLWTLRSYDEQLKSMPAETLPEDFIYDIEIKK